MPNYFKLGSFKVSDKAVEFFAVPPGKANVEDKEQLLAAYWWVTGCGNQSEANMEVEMKERKGINIPNSKEQNGSESFHSADQTCASSQACSASWVSAQAEGCKDKQMRLL